MSLTDKIEKIRKLATTLDDGTGKWSIGHQRKVNSAYLLLNEYADVLGQQHETSGKMITAMLAYPVRACATCQHWGEPLITGSTTAECDFLPTGTHAEDPPTTDAGFSCAGWVAK